MITANGSINIATLNSRASIASYLPVDIVILPSYMRLCDHMNVSQAREVGCLHTSGEELNDDDDYFGIMFVFVSYLGISFLRGRDDFNEQDSVVSWLPRDRPVSSFRTIYTFHNCYQPCNVILNQKVLNYESPPRYNAIKLQYHLRGSFEALTLRCPTMGRVLKR